MVAPALLTIDTDVTLFRSVVTRIARVVFSVVASIKPELVMVVAPPPTRITSEPTAFRVPPASLVIEKIAAFDVTALKSSTRPLVVDWMVPKLSTVTVPLVRLFWIRNASLADVSVAPALLRSVKLPLMALFEVSMPRDVAEIVPLLVITTPGEASPVVQVIAVPVTESVLPAPTKPVSLLDTVLAVVALSGGTLKLAAIAGQDRLREVAEKISANRLASLKNRTCTFITPSSNCGGNMKAKCDSCITHPEKRREICDKMATTKVERDRAAAATVASAPLCPPVYSASFRFRHSLAVQPCRVLNRRLFNRQRFFHSACASSGRNPS